MGDFINVLLAQLQDNLWQLAFVLGGIFLLGKTGKAQPTGRTFALILLPALLYGLSGLWPWLYFLANVFTPVLILLLLADAFYLTAPSRAIQLSRVLSAKLSIGQPNTVAITLINNSGQRLRGTLQDSIPAGLRNQTVSTSEPFEIPIHLIPFSHQTVHYNVLPLQRGTQTFEKIHFRYKSRLGLLWMTLQSGRTETVKVMPDLRRMQAMRLMASKALTAGELQKRSLGLEGTQFSGLRHYFAGDDIRKIAWQATAKQDLPVIRTFTHEVEQPIMVLLDAGRKMNITSQTHSGIPLSKYDWALNAALAFMGVAIDRGDAVGVGVFSNRVIKRTGLVNGRHHLNRILDSLSETQVQAVEPDYEPVMLQFARSLKRRSLVVIFTDLIDPMASRSLLRSLKSFSSNHILMVVTQTDSETEAAASQLPETPYDAYTKGVAMDLQDLRQQTRMALSKANNVIVIDAPPDKLDETLINRYLQLKRNNRF